jgi:hypothetical protein
VLRGALARVVLRGPLELVAGLAQRREQQGALVGALVKRVCHGFNYIEQTFDTQKELERYAMKYVVFYESADDVMSKAPAHFPAHKERLDEFHARGDLLMVRALRTGTKPDLDSLQNWR